MLRKVSIWLLKIFITSALLFWLLKSGKLDFKLLSRMLDYPGHLVICFLLMALNLVFVSARWKIILGARSMLPLPLKRISIISWIGMMFSSVLPGSVMGDLVKIFYVKKMDDSLSNRFLLFSVLADRAMGLMGLIFIIGFCSFLNLNSHISWPPEIGQLFMFNSSLLILILVVFLVFYFYPQCFRILLRGKLRQLFDDFEAIKNQLLKALLLSLVIQFIGISIFYLASYPYYQTAIRFLDVLSFIPLGFVALAIPVSPGGLGVGHVAFQKLFEMIHEPDGANFFNFYFCLTMIFSLLGAIPYLIFRKHKSN